MARKKKGQTTPDASKPEGQSVDPAASTAKGGKKRKSQGCRSGNKNGQSAKQIAAEAKMRENQKEALEFRKQGFTYREIGDLMEVSPTTASNWVKAALAEIPREAAEDVLAMENDRLDAMLQKAMSSFMDAEGSAAYADIEMLLKLQNQKLRLHNLNGMGEKAGGEADDVFRSMGEKMAEHMRADAPILNILPGTKLPANPIL